MSEETLVRLFVCFVIRKGGFMRTSSRSSSELSLRSDTSSMWRGSMS